MRTMIPLALALAAAPLAAHATDAMSYRYLEGGALHAHNRTYFVDVQSGNGGFLRGAWDITAGTYVFGSYHRVKDDHDLTTLQTSNTYEQGELGLGWHRSLDKRLDVTADIAWIGMKETFIISGYVVPEGNDSPNGKWSSHRDAVRATAGLRGMPMAHTEAWIRAGVMDGSEMSRKFYAVLGGQYKLDRTWSVVADVQWIGNQTHIYAAGIRASF